MNNSIARHLADQAASKRSHLYVAEPPVDQVSPQLFIDDIFNNEMKAVVAKPSDEHFILSDLAHKFPHVKSLIFTLYAQHQFTAVMRELIKDLLVLGPPANQPLLNARELVSKLQNLWQLQLHHCSGTQDDIDLARELIAEIVKQTETNR